jgi:hypothetical protein
MAMIRDKRGHRPHPLSRNDVAVEMDAEVARKAEIVAAFRDQTLAEFLSVTLGSIIDLMLDEAYDKGKKVQAKASQVELMAV